MGSGSEQEGKVGGVEDLGRSAMQMGIIKRIQQDLSGRYRDPYPRDR